MWRLGFLFSKPGSPAAQKLEQHSYLGNDGTVLLNLPVGLNQSWLEKCLCSFRDGGKAARCCGRCVGSCCWSWSPSCRTPAALSCPWTVASRKRASPSTLASGRSTWSRPALCCASTAPWWASQVSGWSSRTHSVELKPYSGVSPRLLLPLMGVGGRLVGVEPTLWLAPQGRVGNQSGLHKVTLQLVSTVAFIIIMLRE